jgi:hypothetical protein
VDLTAQLTERRTIGCLLKRAVNDYCNWLGGGNVIANTWNLANNLIGFEDCLNLTNGASYNKATAHRLAFKLLELGCLILVNHLDRSLFKALLGKVNQNHKDQDDADKDKATKL